MFMLVSISAFANSISTARNKFGMEILLTFPITLEFNIRNFDIDLGAYSKTNNFFKDWKILFLAIDYIFYTHTFAGADNILDFTVGGGGNGTIWFSRWINNKINSGPMSLRARLPLSLNLAIARKFDIFLKVAPDFGLNIWSFGMRFWFA